MGENSWKYPGNEWDFQAMFMGFSRDFVGLVGFHGIVFLARGFMGFQFGVLKGIEGLD